MSVGPTAPPGLGTNPLALPEGPPLPAGVASPATSSFQAPPDALPFRDPSSPENRATGRFFSGSWLPQGGYLAQRQGALRPALSFRTYVGDDFGTADGLAPAHYRADVTVWGYQPAAQYPDMVGAPLGILGFAPYFLDETHYLLVVAKPLSLEVWAVEGQLPGTAWPPERCLLKRALPRELRVGDPVAWSAEVDTQAKILRLWHDGAELGRLAVPMLADCGPRVALVSNGNFLHFQNFRVFPL